MADQHGARVAWITIAPVKGLALNSLLAAVLGRDGVACDRTFYLIDRAGRLVNGKRLSRLLLVRPQVEDGRLALRFSAATARASTRPGRCPSVSGPRSSNRAG